MSGAPDKLLAVLIDADNIPARFAEAILKEITRLGEPALRRVYGDWSSPRLKPWSDKVHALGLVAHQETANTKGKNASDIGLVIDAMDILHKGRFDGFVLVSSDSDFTALANRIREEGKAVYGIGEAKTPVSLRNVCSQFILIENLLDEPVQATLKAKGKASEIAPPPEKRPPTDAIPLIIRAMDKIDQEGEWFSLSQISNAIRADQRDFDPRSYGKTKMVDLIKELKRFETRREGNHIFVRRAD